MADWDPTAYPANSLKIKDIPLTFREVEQSLETLLEREHLGLGSTIGSGITGGTHKSGSARAFFQDAAPTTRVDGSAFTDDDLGALWFDSNTAIDNTFYVMTVSGASPTWTPVSTAIIATLLAADRIFLEKLKSTKDFTVGADKLVVTAASGNIVSAGSLGVASFVTTGGGFIDEDTMATNSASKAPSQQSVKAYVDANVGDSYRLTSVNGSSVKVYTKYFFGTTAASGNTKVVTHLCGAYATKILNVNAFMENPGGTALLTNSFEADELVAESYWAATTDTTVTLTYTDGFRSKAYKIKIDYIA